MAATKTRSKMRKFPSIEQYRNVIQGVQRRSSYLGQDEEGKAVYSSTATHPTLTFQGTVKLHGTNAGVGMAPNGEVWYQSRNNIINAQCDNCGFAAFCETKKQLLQSLYAQVKARAGDHHSVMFYGEWCGGNIQSGVAISGLPKMYVIFGVKVLKLLTEEEMKERVEQEESVTDPVKGEWLHEYAQILDFPRDQQVYLAEDFGTWSMEIDFNDPQRVQNDLGDLTMMVEEECPVGKYFGRVKGMMQEKKTKDGLTQVPLNTTGEGIVWVGTHHDETYRFKVKGKQHSVSKVKVLAPVNIEKLNSINEFIDYAVTESRLMQGVQEVNGHNVKPIIKNTGVFVNWVKDDICKEEADVLAEYGFSMGDVAKAVGTKASRFYVTLCKK
jgi:hypothetical protein